MNVKGDDKGILESDRGIFCSFCLITQGKGQSHKKKNGIKMSKYKTDRRNWVFSLCCIIMGTSEGKSLLSKRKKFMYFCSQKEALLGKISANHQLVCLSALSKLRSHSGDSKGNFFSL